MKKLFAASILLGGCLYSFGGAGLVTGTLSGGGGGTNISYVTNVNVFNFNTNVTVINAFTNAGTFYVSTNGSDSAGIRGRIDEPFLSVGYVATNIANNSAMILAAGNFIRSNLVNQVAPITATNVKVTGASREGTLISDWNLSNIQGFSQGGSGSGWAWENLTFDIVNGTNSNAAATYIGISYDNTNVMNVIWRNVNFLFGNDAIVYSNEQDGALNGTTNIVRQEFDGCYFRGGWDVFADFQPVDSEEYCNWGGNPASVFILRNCVFDMNTNNSSGADAAGQMHIFNFHVMPSLYIENSYFKFVGGKPDFPREFGLGLVKVHTLTNEEPGSLGGRVTTNAMLFIKDVHMDFWGTNVEDPQVIIDLYRAVSTNVYVENFTWRSNGVLFKYSTVVGVEMTQNITPFANLGISAQSTNYTGAVGPFVIAAWAHNQSTPGFGVNTALGTITNLVAGYYAISFSADISDLDSTTGGNFNARLYTNGVAAGSSAFSDIDEQITTFIEINVVSVNRLSLPPQVFWLPANTRIDMRIGMSTTAGFFVRSAVLDVVRR